MTSQRIKPALSRCTECPRKFFRDKDATDSCCCTNCRVQRLAKIEKKAKS